MPTPEQPTPAPQENQKPQASNTQKPQSQPAPAAPQKTGTQPANQQPADGKVKRKPRTGLLLSFIGLFLFLFALFIVFLVVMLLQNGGDNPILGALGVEPALLKDLLQTLISLVFGFLSFVSFIVFLVGVFRRFTATKVEVEKKKQSLIIAIVSGLFFSFCVFVWLMLFFYISRIQVGGSGQAVILTEPQNTVQLTAPVNITFDAVEIERLFLREGIVSYAWDLDGDGVFDDGNGRAIQFTYTTRGNNEGTYNVGVKITLADGREQVVERLVTIANVLPVPDISYSPSVLEVPLDVTFDASDSIDADGNIISYEWDFDGDGGIDATGPNVTQNFSEAKTVEVALLVTDNNGAQAEERITLDMRRGRTKEAVIVARPGTKGQVPFEVSFDGSNSFIGESIQSYEWDFGDGSPVARGRLAQHVYDEQGTYPVQLVVRSAGGERFEAQEEIVVEIPTNAPKAVLEVLNASADDDGVYRGEAPFTLEFSADESTDLDGSIIDYRWDFDEDGISDAVGPEAAHTFVDTGLYSVLLTVIDNDDIEGQATVMVEISVPDISVELDVSTFSGPVPLEVTFDATASRADEGKIISFTWDFGDESSEVIGSARQTHVFNTVGEYVVSVEALTDTGKRQSKEVTVVAREVELQADFSVNPQTLVAGDKAFFDASLSQGQISRYYWEFGDGQISRVVKPEHVYTAAGEYEVTLEIYDRKNRVSRKETTITVTAP